MQKHHCSALLRREKPSAKRILLAKLMSFLLLVACLQGNANVNGQSISLSVVNVSLPVVFKSITNQTGVTFFFDENWLKEANAVTIDVKNVPLEQVLDICFRGQPLTYAIVGKTVVVKQKAPAAATAAFTAPMLVKDIKGTVTDDKGVPLAGVSVTVKGSQKGTTTDVNGVFSIDVSPDDVLEFSMIGYKSVSVAAGREGSLSVHLSVDITESSEVVVIGYGSMKKGDLSAAVSTVPDIAQIKNRPVLNVESMIQGKVPGVTSISNGGHPNSTPKITIRGVGSRQDENVLFVVDGVPNAPFNPSDVESIVVLKDAASAAIYGAFSGASGVILITTRQATSGKPTVEYSGFVGAKNAWRLPQSLTADQEAKVSNLAYTNAGLTPLSGWDATLNPYAQVNRTDWVGEIFRTGVIQRHTVSLNAGTDKFSTLLQARYENEDGTLINTFNKNLSMRLNTNYQFNRKVKLRQEIFWNNNDNRGTETSSGYSGTILSAIYMPRSATPYYEDGTFGGVGPRESQYLGIHGDAINPVATLLRNKPFNKASDLQSVTELNVNQILPGLNYISRFSYRQSSLLYKNFEPRRTEPGKPNSQNTLSYRSDRSYSWIWENTLNYTKTIARHNIGAMASMTAQESGFRNFATSAKGFESEADWAQFFINATVFDQNRPTDDQWKDRTASYVGRVSYSWADRYFLTGSYRYDLAARLASKNRGKGFPGVTAAWKLSSEPFFHLSGVDLLKVRASWGRIGNLSSIPRYYGYATLNPDITYQVGEAGAQSNALYLSSLVNPSLSWETSQQTDVGLDIALLNKHLDVTIDYFDKLTFDLIKQQDNGWPNTNGLAAPYINQGKISNKGFEFAATWRDDIGKVGYQIGANLATLKNRVAYIDDNPKSSWTHGDAWRGVLLPYRSMVGQPYYSYYLVKTAGIFKTDQDAANYKSKDGTVIQPNAKAGDLKFVDQNGDGQINDDDKVYMGSAFPKITYGLTGNFTWKNFDLSIFFQGVGGVKLFHAFKQSTLNGAEQGYNRWNKILDAWSPENPNSNIPRVSATDPNKNFQTASDWFLESGDYLRIKNIIIGYTFSKMSWNSGLRVYLSADNLLTITKYSGMDPEVGGIGLDGGQFPLSRVIAAGVKINL